MDRSVLYGFTRRSPLFRLAAAMVVREEEARAREGLELTERLKSPQNAAPPGEKSSKPDTSPGLVLR